MTVTSTNQKVQFNGNGSTTVFAYNFKIFAQTDLSVILRSAAGTETVQQLTTNYTVSGVGEASGGNVTMGTAPASGTTLTILRVQPNLQGLDLVPNDPFPAGSMEDALDKLTFMVQTHDEEIGRSIKASRTNVIGDSEFTVSATDRANKLFSFDGSGNLSIAQELGTYKGNWAASTAYAVRDLVKDTSTGNIFICVTAHTSSGSQPLTTNTDAAKWALIVDAASATTSATAAASSATAAASSATAAASSATTSGNSATAAASSATAAASSATAAGSSATAAASSATSAASTLTTFQQQYHGAASSNPTSNLTEGDLYFQTGSGGGLRIYNGSAWVAAAFDVSGALINTNNLSDVSNAATALTNLGVNSTAAELNLLDGVSGLVQADFTKLAAIDSSATEINQLDAITRGSIIYGNASGATARLAKGGANTVLTSDGTDLSWATPSSGGFEAVVFPSNWASPTSTFTSSGTYSKGSLADDDYVWVYLVGGGGGGSKSANDNIYPGGVGGRAMLIYAQAGVLHGGAYVVGAGAAGQTGTQDVGSNPTVSSFTLTNSNGGNIFATATGVNNPSSGVGGLVTTVLKNSSDATPILTATELTDVTFSGVLPSGAASFFQGGSFNNDNSGDVVFGGGSGAGKRFSSAIASNDSVARSDSIYAGNGAAATSAATGVAPGGGGTVGDGVNGGAGAAGSVRIYNV